MEMRKVGVEFATREGAESVIRKLAFLRCDSFVVTEAVQMARDGVIDGSYTMEASRSLGDLPHGADGSIFMLSANVPTDAAERALTVVAQAGGLNTALSEPDRLILE